MHDSHLTIAGVWNGEPLPIEDHIQLHARQRNEKLQLSLDAPFHDDPAPPHPPGSVDGLWSFEVVELFIAGPAQRDGAIPYLEIELGPHGHYLVLQLSDIRQVAAQGLPLDFQAEIDRDAGRWRGTAVIPASYLPPLPHCVNAYAIHGVGDERRYLAWQPVPGARPDFHQPRHFAALGSSMRRTDQP